MRAVIYCMASDRQGFNFGALQEAGIEFKVYDAGQAQGIDAVDAAAFVVPNNHSGLQALVRSRKPGVPLVIASFAENAEGQLVEALSEAMVDEDAGLSKMTVKELNALIDDQGLDVDMKLNKGDKVKAIEEATA